MLKQKLGEGRKRAGRLTKAGSKELKARKPESDDRRWQALHFRADSSDNTLVVCVLISKQ